MTQTSIITDMRVRVLRTLRRRAHSHAAQTAFALAQGAEDIRACLEDRAARNDESIRAARRTVKDTRICGPSMNGPRGMPTLRQIWPHARRKPARLTHHRAPKPKRPVCDRMRRA